MYQRTREQLNAEIHKENEVRKVLNREVPKLMEILKLFVGQKLRKADGELVKKLTDQTKFLLADRQNIPIKPIKGQKYARISNMYLTATDYSVRLEVSISFSDGDHTCCYKEGTTYLVDINSGIVKELYEWNPWKMLSADQEWQNYQEAFEAKEAAENAVGAMFYGLREWVR